MTARLTAEDLEVVHETLAEIRDMPPPRDNQATGCLMALAGLALLVLVPAVGRAIGAGAGSGLPTAGLLLGGGLLVVGVVVWLTAGGFVRGHYIAAAEAAARQLEQWSPEDGDRVLALRAATLMLTHSVVTYGPTSSEAFDPAAVEARLPTVMPLVLAVQAVLVEEGATYAVFPSGKEDVSEGR